MKNRIKVKKVELIAAGYSVVWLQYTIDENVVLLNAFNPKSNAWDVWELTPTEFKKL